MYSAFSVDTTIYILLIPIHDRPTFCRFVVVAVLVIHSFSFLLFHMCDIIAYNVIVKCQ